MSDEKKTYFCALLMQTSGKVESNTYFSEAEADEFALEYTDYGELDPEYDDPDHWEKYDPAMVLLFEAETTEAYWTGKYTRPVALYRRGEKWRIVKDKKE